MKFAVDKKIFEKMPGLYIATVTAKGPDNSVKHDAISQMLAEYAAEAEGKFKDKKVKEEPSIVPYREAFRAAGINPNKFMCSVEALFTRIAKGKGMPSINALVDLGNAVSLKYNIPIGAHDLSVSSEDMEVRYSRPGDTFIPFGGEEREDVDSDEMVYAVGSTVRTRRWTWRQSEIGKITEDTSYIFYPIDGFVGVNREQADEAAAELERLLREIFGCSVVRGFVSADSPQTDITL